MWYLHRKEFYSDVKKMKLGNVQVKWGTGNYYTKRGNPEQKDICHMF